ncbi:MAG: 50S ribosomal protein L11 methyltransferase, partial [Gemmatimonadales bacterium]
MSWISLKVAAPSERREALGAWLVAHTGQAVEERDDGTLLAFAATAEDADRLERELRGAWDTALTRAEMPEVNWVERWRDGIPSRQFGRLVVTPSWLADPSFDGPQAIIDPETAFGTGEHGSTRAALALLERHVQPGDRMLDLGSGSGILS